MALKFETANWECLQRVIENQKDVVQKSYSLCRRDETNAVIQLSRFCDPIEIERNFYVDSMGSGDRKFLMWKQNQEEVVLHYQGIVTQACVTPFINSSTRCTRPGSIRQYVQVVSVSEDTVFDQARSAVRQIHAFMADFASNPDRLLLHDSHFGGTKAIYADSKLLVTAATAGEYSITIPVEIDTDGVLSSLCQRTNHKYIEDSQVFFYEWVSQGDNLTLEVRDNGRCLKPGQVVDIGVAFRLIRSKRNDTRFLTKLDSVTIIDRNGSEKLDNLQRSNNGQEDGFKGPKRKRMPPCTLDSQTIFSGSNMV